MPITSVRYSKLYNLGNYQNERFEVEVALAPNQTPEEAMAEARRFVEAQRYKAQQSPTVRQDPDDPDDIDDLDDDLDGGDDDD